jgi:TonB-dependent starch-binding outer membrane protein SusC
LAYYWSAGYAHNQGYIKGDEHRIFRSRVNLDAEINNFLKLRLNAQYSDRDDGFQSANLTQAIQGSPFGEIYDEEGNMTWYTNEELVSGNPLLYYTYRDIFNKTQALFSNLSAELSLPLGFSFIVSYVNRYSWNRRYLFDPIETPNGSSQKGYGERRDISIYEWQIDNLLKWKKTISKIHNFDLTLLFNAEKFQSWDNNQSNSDFSPNDALSFHAMGAGNEPALGSNDQFATGNALMGRLNYSLMNKYLLTMTWRKDGYSAFGQANPYGTFPSVALAWRISEENFFNFNRIDYLKFRTSWGINGNRDIGRYDALARLGTIKYLYGNTPATGVYTSTMANSKLKWEKTEAFNFGIDLGLFQNKLGATIDFYTSITNDLLINRTLPVIIGFNNVSANLGKLENKGIELTVNSLNNIIENKLTWRSTLNFSLNRNKIKSLYGIMTNIYDENGNIIGQKEADDWTNNWFIGQSIFRIWDYERIGVWQLDEVEEASLYGRSPGDIKAKDQNSDGVMTPEDDKIFQGFSRPQYNLGFRNDFYFLGNFELSVFLRADLDFYRRTYIDQQSMYINRRNILDFPYWTSENPSNEYARLSSPLEEPYGVWKNSSFLRVQDVTLSYIVNQNFIDKINKIKIYLNFRNLYTITKWDHWDPESGTSPMPKYSTLGVNFSL